MCSVSRLMIQIVLALTLVHNNTANALNRIVKSRYSHLIDKYEMVIFENIPQIQHSIGNTTIISVHNQSDFDLVSENLQRILKTGAKDITIRVFPGRYYFHDNHISLKNSYNNDVSIHIIGDGAEIVSAGHYILKHDVDIGAFSPFAIYLDKNHDDICFWSNMYQSDTLVEILEEKSKVCRIHCKDINLPVSTDCSNAWLQLTEWYMSGTYKVQRVEGHYIYFIASDLKKGIPPYGNFNVNYDYTVVKKFPRFRICNLPISSCRVTLDRIVSEAALYQCTSSCFLNIYGSDFKQIDLSGLKFVGNCKGSKLFNLQGARTKNGLFITNCQFSAIQSIVIYMLGTPNVVISRCIFKDCYDYVLLGIDKGTKNTIITENLFYNVGKGLNSSAAIHCQSTDFYIAKNEIVNFGMMGIGVGKGAAEDDEGSGIVEDNVLYFTDEYFAKAPLNSLIDGGAIYLWTRNNGTIVRFNRIHQYTGAHSNRGIYCDDGAYGFVVYGNVISGVYNNNLIDSRYVPSQTLPTNTNNFIMYNIITGRYKFEGSAIRNNQCIKGQNLVLLRSDEGPYNIVLNNLSDSEDDCILEYTGTKGLKIIVPRKTRQALRQLPFYKRIQRFISL